MDNVKEADRIMLRLVEENKNDYRAHLARARYLGQRRLPQEQERETIQAHKLAPNQAEAVLAMADLSLSKRKLDEARGYLRNGLKLYPDDAALYLALANVAMSARQADEAVSILREGLKTVPAPGRNSLYHELALYLIQRGEPERQIDEIVKALEAGHAPRTVLEELQARLLIRKEEWSQALTILVRLRPLTAADPEFAAQINYLLGFCYDQRGEPDRALAAYRQAALDNPRLLQARLAGAAALMALGRFDEALGEYRALLPKEPAVGTTLARLLVLRNMRLDPQKQDWQQVDRALDQAEKAKPRSVEVTIVRAQALAAQNKPDQAQDLLDKACRAHPKEIDLWLALANTAELRGNIEESYQILRAAEERYLGDRVELRLARAHYWTRSGSPAGVDARAALAQIEENVDRFSADDRVRLCTRLGEIYHQAGNGKEARRLWTRAAALRPRDMQIRLALFRVARACRGHARCVPSSKRITSICCSKPVTRKGCRPWSRTSGAWRALTTRSGAMPGPAPSLPPLGKAKRRTCAWPASCSPRWLPPARPGPLPSAVWLPSMSWRAIPPKPCTAWSTPWSWATATRPPCGTRCSSCMSGGNTTKRPAYSRNCRIRVAWPWSFVAFRPPSPASRATTSRLVASTRCSQVTAIAVTGC